MVVQAEVPPYKFYQMCVVDVLVKVVVVGSGSEDAVQKLVTTLKKYFLTVLFCGSVFDFFIIDLFLLNYNLEFMNANFLRQ